MGNALARRRRNDISVDDYTGRQKVAILMMALGDEASAAITQKLSPEEVEAISFEIARMEQVDQAVVEAVLDEWEQTEQAAFSLAEGGVDFARKLLEKALGTQKAQTVLKRIEAQLNDHISLSHLRRADPQQLTAVLRTEHPQSIALILAFLDPTQTAELLKELPAELGGDVLLRMARMEKVLPDVLAAVETSVGAQSDLSLSSDVAASRAGGPQSVAEILNLVATGLEKDLLDRLETSDKQLSEEIKDLMFVFDDITNLDDKSVARLLRDVDTRQLALALKVASEELKEKLMGGLSTRARDSLIQEMEFLGPVRVGDVYAAQGEIVKTARALDEAGEITIGGSDELVVE